MTTDDLVRQFFYSWPFTEPKPPSSAFGVLNKEKTDYAGIEIQFAVAGFQEEDLNVWNEGRTIHVEGDNLKRDDVAEKFKCRFQRLIPLQESLDIEGAVVDLSDGILSIKVMRAESDENRKKLS